MSPATTEPDTLADVLHALGDVPLHRIIWRNLGTATEDDQLELCDRKLRVELVDGVLVHKGIDRDVLDEVLASVAPGVETLADVHDRLGNVPLNRILWTPRPGTATEEDVIRCVDREPKRLVELVDGILVEKPMGNREGLFAMTFGIILGGYVRSRNLGIAAAPDAIVRMRSGRRRLPDIYFTPWERLPSRRAHLGRVANYPIDLAVEILSDSNTRAEMASKRREYFDSGTLLIWEIDPVAETVDVYETPADPDTHRTLTRTDTLDGGTVVTGFTLPLQELFDDPQLNDRPE
jgi:Uma2 family endonuclease